MDNMLTKEQANDLLTENEINDFESFWEYADGLIDKDGLISESVVITFINR